MAYWLMKSEPFKWSWSDLVKSGETNWQKPVRNYQARNNMKAMKKGDKAFYYHSNEGLEIVGVMEITGEYYPCPKDDSGKFVTVDVRPDKEMPIPVSLKQIKSIPDLNEMAFIKQVRLSVSPVREEEWNIISQLGGIK